MRRSILILLSLLAGTTIAGVSDPHAACLAFLHPNAAFTPVERAALRRGQPIVAVRDGEDRELTVVSTIQVAAEVTPERMLAWMRDVARFRQGPFVDAVRTFSDPPQLSDLEALTLDDGDLHALRKCRPGDCGLKLSAAELATLQGVIEAAGAGWKAAVQAAFRRLVLRRIAAYIELGHAGLGDYNDHRQPRSPAVAYSQLRQRYAFLSKAPRFPAGNPSAPGAPVMPVAEFIYWSKERFGGKAVVSATDVHILRPPAGSDVEVVMIATQIFATHYLDASIGITALVGERAGTRRYFVYINRSDVDVLGGLWGGVARRIIKGRIEETGPNLLRAIARRLASGEPSDQAGAGHAAAAARVR